MAYSYGKETLNIKNPFKKEGILDLGLGVIITLFGILILFGIKNSIDSGLKIKGWIQLITAVCFLFYGIKYIFKGSFRIFRFLVGRDVPSYLIKTKTEPFRPYLVKGLKQLLIGRTNFTFIEKSGFVPRLLISVFNKSLFLPLPLKNLAEGLVAMVLHFLLNGILFLLVVFSISVGLLHFNQQSVVLEWYALLLIHMQLLYWFSYYPKKSRLSLKKPSLPSVTSLIIGILFAVFSPLLIEILVSNQAIPSVGLAPYILLGFIFFSYIIIIGLAFVLSKNRLQFLRPETEVSEIVKDVQAPFHPSDLFRQFEKQMLQKRFKEHPNRIYEKLTPTLQMEGSKNKGSFKGSIVMETQPVSIPLEYNSSSIKLKFIAAIIGRVFILIASVLFFINVSNIGLSFSLDHIINSLYYPLLIFLLGTTLKEIAHLFYAEILFESHLVHIKTEGSFSESKVSTGMGVHDSNRSENTITNTQSTLFIYVSKIISTTFANSSTQNLEDNRYILELYKDDTFINEVDHGILNDFSNKDVLVSLHSKNDLDNSLKYHNLNNLTRNGQSKPTNETDAVLKENQNRKLHEMEEE